jgi:LmbE family N-acetylglucosaminyl deacetylase
MDDPSFAGVTILAVFAHPDDESLACGGTLARLADAGARVVLVCASRGDRGSLGGTHGVIQPDLGRVRAAELRAAAESLGIADLLILGHPDGALRWAEVPQFHGELMITLRRYRPDAVLTFGEDGLYWHADHIGVHERTATAVRSLGDEAPLLYAVTMPVGTMQALVRAARARGGAAADSGFLGIHPDAFGLSAEPPTVAIDVRPWIARKMAALRCHRTQMGPRNPLAWIDDDDARGLLGIEHFARMTLDNRRASDRPHGADEPPAAGLLELIGEPPGC